MSPGGSVTAVHTAPYRIRAPIVRDVPAGQCGTENGVVVYAALIMAQENLPRPYHRKERPFWKSASANRPGPGFCPGKIGKAPERRRGLGDMPCTRTPPNGSTSESASADRRGRGTLLRQSRKATPGGAAQAARRSGSEMSQTSKQRRRPAKACRAGLPLKGAVTK